MTNWSRIIGAWKLRYDFSVRPATSTRLLDAVESKLGNFPEPLREFYQSFNGLTSGWFALLAVENPDDIKHTWDGIQRANDPLKTKYLDGDTALLQRFLVFAHLDALQCAAYDRSDGSIWYEQESELVQTDLSLEQFIETCLREVKGLS